MSALPSEFVETSSLLTGRKEGSLWICNMHFLSTGRPVRVEFDWAVVIDREEKYGDVAGFCHTHPFGFDRPSRRDIKTMRAWCDCLGKHLLCVIGIPTLDTPQINGYLFRNYRSLGRKIRFIAQEAEQLTFKE